MARRIIKATTQLCLRSSDIPSLSRRYISNDRMLRYPRNSCNIFTDTVFGNKEKCTSTRGNDNCQLFVFVFGFSYGTPMKVVCNCVTPARNSSKGLECLPA